MLEVQHIDALKRAINACKQQSKSIAFVPTMGNLHAGHISLVNKARAQADFVVVSIFVNPLQFGINEDLDAYPRTLKNDLKLLRQAHCDLVFFPSNETLLSNKDTTRVSVPVISEGLEGAVREDHLDGVATIVTKLFNLVQPNIACFGKKDYQQWLMIKKMVKDLNLDINIIGCDTQREDNGLAISSRNQYLSEEERQKAPLFRQVLLQCAQKINTSNIDDCIEESKNKLLKHGFSIDYFELRKQHTLAPSQDVSDSVLISTVRLGSTRLLDNIEL